MEKVKLHLTKRVPGAPVVFLAGDHLQTNEPGSTLFTNALPKDFSFTAHEFVEDEARADYLFFPHAIKSKSDPLLLVLEEAKTHAKKIHKPLMVMVGGDLSHDIFIDDLIVLKGSQYGYLKRENEIVVPPFAEDLSETTPFHVRKKSARPRVGFCGWAAFNNPLTYARYLARNVVLELESHAGNAHALVHKKGLYWRREALGLLQRDPRIETRFIVRSTFSASAKTISLDPAQARREYIQNILDSDFVLAPKGDGNFSVRFYEALSLGRIPILIDTDMVLPLEGIMEYNRFVIRVPYTQIDNLPSEVSDFHQKLTEKEFEEMQRAARAAYTEHLRYDRFFNTLFTRGISLLKDATRASQQQGL